MTARKLHRIRIAFVSAALLLVAAPSMAAVPATVLVEGALTATGGGPAADGNYNVTFSLYSEAGGNPVWTEVQVPISVKNGLFAYGLGSKTKLDQAALAQLGKGVIGIKVEGDPELGQKPLHSAATALRAAVAEGLDCSGCVKAGALDPDSMKAFAKTADLAKVATTGNFSDLNGGPDLSAYAKKSELAKVAGTGQYGDLQGAPTLAKVATTGAYGDLANLPTLADVAKSGSYADLKNLPVEAKLGAACGTGLVMKGIKADGSYDCTASLDANTIAIDDITKGLMFFGETYVGTKNVLIPDNRANSQEEKDIAIDKIAVPNIGTATKLSVTVELAKDAGNSNSNVADKRILLVAPDNSVYTLFCGAVAGEFKVDGKILCDKPNSEKDYPFLKVYPNPDPVLVGDLTTWIGKNPAGTWTIKVHDYGFNGNGTDGKIATWSLNIHTYGTKRLNLNGSMVAQGSVQVGEDPATCVATKSGTLRYNPATKSIDLCNGTAWVASYGAGGFPNSKLITPVYAAMINGWIGNPFKEWKLCYRRSTDGGDSGTWHGKCNSKGDTVTVAKFDNGLVIGGYAACEWISKNNYHYQCGGSFLFSLSRGHKYEKRWWTNGDGVSFSHSHHIYDHSGYGPTFGGGHDWHVSSNMTTGYCNLGHDYTCRRYGGDSTSNWSGYGAAGCRNDFCGSHNGWSITELETWYSADL
jgi:hypothetical protein